MLDAQVANREAVHLSQPELESSDVGVTSQVACVLRKDKGAVIFRIDQGAIVNRVRSRVIVCQPVQHHAASTGVE